MFFIDYLYALTERNQELRVVEQMSTYKETKLSHLYDYAIQNGFEANWVLKT